MAVNAIDKLIYISRLCYDVSVRLSVRLSVTVVLLVAGGSSRAMLASARSLVIIYICCFIISYSTFLPLDALLSAVYAVVVCLCVCMCVCLSHSGIVSKRLNIGSRKQRRMIAQ